MVTTYSETATRLLHNIQPFSRPEDGDNPLRDSNKIALQHTYIHPYAPQMGFPPLGGSNKTSSLLRFPHSEKCLYVPLLRFLPLGDGNANMPTSQSSCGSRNPPLWNFSHSESPTLLQEFFPLRAPVCCSAAGIFPTRNTNTSLRAPLV